MALHVGDTGEKGRPKDVACSRASPRRVALGVQCVSQHQGAPLEIGQVSHCSSRVRHLTARGPSLPCGRRWWGGISAASLLCPHTVRGWVLLSATVLPAPTFHLPHTPSSVCEEVHPAPRLDIWICTTTATPPHVPTALGWLRRKASNETNVPVIQGCRSK